MTTTAEWKRPEKKGNFAAVFEDVLMLVLIVVNLVFIIFDWHFGFEFFRNFLRDISPEFFVFYRDHIHPDFLLYDLVFVSIFIIELLIRWGIAIKKHTYERWFFYPFVHWYDVLGCIPLGAFRWLRILRIFSLMVRLHRMGIVNLKETYVVKKTYEIYRIFVEEITDRVIINMLNGVQREIHKNSPVTTSMLSDVVKPHVDTISQWMSSRIQQITEDSYSQYKNELKDYIEKVVKEGFDNSKEVKKIELIPIIGKQLIGTVENSISDVTFQLINSMANNVASEENKKLIKKTISATLDSMLQGEKDKELDRITKNIFIEALEKIKTNVGKKTYKIKNDEEPSAMNVFEEMEKEQREKEYKLIHDENVDGTRTQN